MVRRALARWVEVDEGLADPQRVGEFFAEDAVTTFSGFAVEQSTFRGWDEFLEFRAAWMEPYDDFSYEAKEILDAGANQVVVILHQRGKTHDSDSWVEMDYGLVFTVEEGLIRQAEFYPTPDQALQAAGLSE